MLEGGYKAFLGRRSSPDPPDGFSILRHLPKSGEEPRAWPRPLPATGTFPENHGIADSRDGAEGNRKRKFVKKKIINDHFNNHRERPGGAGAALSLELRKREALGCSGALPGPGAASSPPDPGRKGWDTEQKHRKARLSLLPAPTAQAG